MTTPLAQLIAAQSLGYLAGYDLGRSSMQHWEPVAEAYDQRLSQLRFFRVVRPFGHFVAVPESTVSYNEAVYAYLFGLPNASVPMSTRCLELGLTHCYESSSPGSTRPKLNGLIHWAENKLGPRHHLAHSVRLLRNLIHQKTPIPEPSALEALRHVSLLVDCLLPFQTAYIVQTCPFCGAVYSYAVVRADYYLGSILTLSCGSCGKASLTQVL